MARQPRRRPSRSSGETVQHTTVSVKEANSSDFLVDEQDRRVLQVTPFEVEPAYVRASAGTTRNLGNYESLRVDVSVTVPCYTAEIEEVYDRAAGLVADLLMQEVDRYLSGN
jgi:hypothetical protein